MPNAYFRGKVGQDLIDKKGYITGALFPEKSLLHESSLEINYSKLPEDFKAPAHFHSESKTWVIVTKGKMYFKVDGTPIEINEGEYVVFVAGITEEVTKVDKGTEAIVIHSPSFLKGDSRKL